MAARDVGAMGLAPLPSELAAFALGLLCMGLLYFLPAGAGPALLVFSVWLTLAAGILRLVGRERFPMFFLLCFFFFPKKTVAEDWWGGLLAHHFGHPSPVTLSFYDVVLMPTLVMAGLWLYRRLPATAMGRWYAGAALAFTGFACAGAAYYLLAGDRFPMAYAPIVVGGSLATAACYLFLKILADQPALLDHAFPRYAKWLVALLFLEYVVASLGITPSVIQRFSMDYRGGFRSALLGYSVLVAFFGLLGLLFAVRDYLSGSRWRDLVIAFMGLALVFATFERSALLAAGLFVLLLVLLDARHRRYGLLLAAFALSLVIVEYRNTWNQQLKEATGKPAVVENEKTPAPARIGPSLSIVRVKGGDAMSTDSLSERFALQLRAIDVFLEAPLTGYGMYSTYMTSVSTIPPRMRSLARGEAAPLYENVVQGRKQSNPHNAMVQALAETGLGVLPLLYMALIFPLATVAGTLRSGATQRESALASALILLALHIYYTFQASPSYYFLFVIAAAMIARPPLHAAGRRRAEA